MNEVMNASYLTLSAHNKDIFTSERKKSGKLKMPPAL
jgi:hypothetical protein